MNVTNNILRCLVAAFLLNLSLPRIAPAEQGTIPAPADAVPVVESGVLAEGLALNERLQQEKQAQKSRFSILPHKPNYLLPLSYSSKPNNYPDGGILAPNENLDPVEVKFQLSIKTPIWEDIIDNNGTLYLAYSQLAFWQAYNGGASAPFREINFEPEAFVAFNTGYELLGVTSQMVTVGINHQSNGRTQPMSRSWNRITANFLFSTGETYVNLRPWYRIPENMQVDDNPHMEKYYGYGELLIIQKLKAHTIALMLRNNLRESGNKGAVQADWSFPLHKQIKGYVQYFNGYGESLLDYNHANNRIGVGVMLSDWL